MRIVQQLVQIKRVREQSRDRERHDATLRHDSAQQSLETRMQLRLRGDESRARRERELYGDLLARKVSVSDILLVGHHMGCMKQEAREALQKEREAEVHLEQAQQHLDLCREELAAARLELEKTAAVQDGLEREERVRLVRSEEAGFDEVCELIDASRRAGPARLGEAA